MTKELSCWLGRGRNGGGTDSGDELEVCSTGGDKRVFMWLAALDVGKWPQLEFINSLLSICTFFLVWLKKTTTSLKTAPSPVVISTRAWGGSLGSRQAGCEWLWSLYMWLCLWGFRVGAGERAFERVHSPEWVLSLHYKNIKRPGNGAVAEWISKQVQVRWPPFPPSTKAEVSFRGDGWEPDRPRPMGQEVGTQTLELGKFASNFCLQWCLGQQRWTTL